ncbi:hypothetical protein V8G54_001867 [Vigna mungo]|uniref:EF-hand domain-containing protein n=1 Tax=Vigna mungo TaxID=3915 RepID=A0AAQ3P882_VIGMU
MQPVSIGIRFSQRITGHLFGPKVIAERLSEEEIGGLKELFKMIDADNSGTITFDELNWQPVLWVNGRFVVQDGQIAYGEFAAMMRKGNGGIGRRTMRSTLNFCEL